MTRSDARADLELRPTTITPGFQMHPEGSVLIEVGRTRVICAASVEDRVPGFLRGQGKGWVTAEYGMLPRATTTRSTREASSGKVGGRTMEIQRLIGRSLRAVIDLDRVGERTIWIDCDVIQADGGTRTASITGAFVAMVLALQTLRAAGKLSEIPVTDYVAATSVGIVDGVALLDLAYDEDSRAEVDMNIIKTGDGRFIEVQGTAEGKPFDRAALDELLEVGSLGIDAPRREAARHRRGLPGVSALLIATSNPGKLREIRDILRDVAGLDLRSLADIDPIDGARRDGRDVRGERPAQGALLRRGHRPADRGR